MNTFRLTFMGVALLAGWSGCSGGRDAADVQPYHAAPPSRIVWENPAPAVPVEPVQAEPYVWSEEAKASLAAEDVEVPATAPIHEAFASPIGSEAQQYLLITVQPPADIQEIAPDDPLPGAAWIPGYWSWDADIQTFIWVSGMWRLLPPGLSWVPGYWAAAENGYYWVRGYWASSAVAVAEVVYLPAPPEPLYEPLPQPILSQNVIWSPGYWYYSSHRYVWQPGYWILVQSDWDWVPAHYVRRPGGYIFVAGYWDYPLHRRGRLFAPVHFHRSTYRQAGFVYRPSVTINIEILVTHLYVRSSDCHYVFGDYRDSGRRGRDIHTLPEFHGRRGSYDEVYANRQRPGRREEQRDRRPFADNRMDRPQAPRPQRDQLVDRRPGQPTEDVQPRPNVQAPDRTVTPAPIRREPGDDVTKTPPPPRPRTQDPTRPDRREDRSPEPKTDARTPSPDTRPTQPDPVKQPEKIDERPRVRQPAPAPEDRPTRTAEPKVTERPERPAPLPGPARPSRPVEVSEKKPDRPAPARTPSTSREDRPAPAPAESDKAREEREKKPAEPAAPPVRRPESAPALVKEPGEAPARQNNSERRERSEVTAPPSEKVAAAPPRPAEPPARANGSERREPVASVPPANKPVEPPAPPIVNKPDAEPQRRPPEASKPDKSEAVADRARPTAAARAESEPKSPAVNERTKEKDERSAEEQEKDQKKDKK